MATLEDLQRLSPEQLDKLLALASAGRDGAAVGPKTPKFSKALDAVPSTAVKSVIEACKQGLDPKTVEGVAEEDREAAQIAPLEKVSPTVAAAARANSLYRGKPITHSLEVAARRLSERQVGQNGSFSAQLALEADVARLKDEVEKLKAAKAPKEPK